MRLPSLTLAILLSAMPAAGVAIAAGASLLGNALDEKFSFISSIYFSIGKIGFSTCHIFGKVLKYF
ncbi:MAG: hypothetical protein RMY16_02010 [Nostoc sp. DedQUE12b]|uniref:hypothetical protein n=1 Tax=Nostoc sp. DedQUE12b TaxID=3075398 RepID=UPI002AD48AB0|nr:hypothetical protein [Nostoc sp. DedQUE12b]MDZ8084360.1 hypothetical protein [Nostoc sp. DedQUE12b]